MSSKGARKPVAGARAGKSRGTAAAKSAKPERSDGVLPKRRAAPAAKPPAAASRRADASPVPDPRTIEQFLYREARLLDERRFEEWRDLFADDGVYWMPTQHGQTSTDEVVSIFYDDRGVMASRIKRLRHPDAHIQVPVSHTAHLVGNVEVEPAPDADGNIVVRAVFLMTEFRRDEPRWLSGRYRYLLARSGADLRIRMKKVELINCDAALPAMAVYA
jgi:benzoate/toluate 1,2-dioxygenase beta subunit